MTADARDALRAVRTVLSLPQHWTKQTLARDALGNPCGPGDPAAARFCIYGALDRVRSPGTRDELVQLLSAEAHRRFGMPLAAFNDEHTHAEVLDFLDAVLGAGERLEGIDVES